MQIDTEDLSSSEKKISVNFTGEDTHPMVKNAIRAIRKNVKIPGFRPGKVPESMIVHRFRDHMEEEILHEVFEKTLKQVEEENEFDLMTRPQLEDYAFEEDWSGHMVVKLDVYPEIELPDLDGIHIPEANLAVSEEETARGLEELRESRAHLVPAEPPCESHHYCVVDLFRTVDEGEEESMGKKLLSPVGDDPVPELEGSKPGSTVRFTKDYPPDDPGPYAGKRVAYRAEIQEIKEQILPDLNDEFATNVLGEEATLDTLNEKVAESLAEQKRKTSEKEARDQIMDQLFARVSIEIPPLLLEQEIQKTMKTVLTRMLQQGASIENVDQQKMAKELEPAAIRRLQEELLLRKFSREWKLRVEDKEVTDAIRRESRHGDKEFFSLVKRLKENGQYESIRYHLTLDKTYEAILDKIKEDITDADTDRS